MHVLIGTVRRRSRLLALATLTALLALAALSVAQVQAQTPAAQTRTWENLKAQIILINDSDGVVQPGDTLEFRVALTHTTLLTLADDSNLSPNPDADRSWWPVMITGGWVRVTGMNMEFDDVSGIHNATRLYFDNDNGQDGVQRVEVGLLNQENLVELRNRDRACSWSYIDGDFMVTCVVADYAYVSGDTGVAANHLQVHTAGTTAMPLSITVPKGTPDGSFTISASVVVDGGTVWETSAWKDCRPQEISSVWVSNPDGCPADVTVTASREISVGTVDEVTDVTLGFATNINGPADPDTYGPVTDLDNDADETTQGVTNLWTGTTVDQGPIIAFVNNTDDDVPYPDSIKAGESTNLSLRILNENGGGAKQGAVSVVILTTNKGNISTSAALGCATASKTCTIQGGASGNLNAMNSGNIGITLEFPSSGETAGVATVEARVIAGSETFERSQDVTFVGAADSLVATAARSVMLNVNAGDDGDTDRDARDVIVFNVAARDSDDNSASLPSVRVRRITGPDGKTVADARIGRTIGDAARPDGSWNITLDSKGTAQQPLAAGDYTVAVTGASKSVDYTFTVVGAADSVTLSEIPADLQPGARVDITATVADADGNAVVDGTAVTITASTIGSGTTLVAVGGTDTTTKDGEASVTFLVTGFGSFYVSATADGKSDVAQGSITAMAAEEDAAPASPSEGLSARNPGYTTWASDTPQQASAVLGDLAGFRSILLAQGTEWLRYGIVDGRPIPGSFDFEITRNAILWLAR